MLQLRAGALPLVRRMPRSVALTASEFVGFVSGELVSVANGSKPAADRGPPSQHHGSPRSPGRLKRPGGPPFLGARIAGGLFKLWTQRRRQTGDLGI